MQPKSVKKKLKTKGFAATVSRDDVEQGAELLQLTLDQHITNCITALQAVETDLGLQPPDNHQSTP